ncbi:hypothetical protein [Modestobacter roseus]|uniref:Uncharacterized protein n=1 Tax=Modestobacter roseus TaxID=1181884 RepID=A0A562ITN7_9ACTN|nr:hypothetical protein [Modestobacter roseus]TWH74292.1 hypothetical protein JD78_02827 [Modestobacter roseus]
MSEPGPNGSSAWRGDRPTPEPLADRPTEVVQPAERWPATAGSGPAPSWPQTAPVAVQHPADEPHDAWRTGATAAGSWPDDADGQPDADDRPAVCRRPDTLAGLLLLLAGVAAGLSLLVVWVNGGETGLELVDAGLADLTGDAGQLAEQLTWAPLAVVFGGAVLFVLGLLLFVPARSHRFLGALALVVALVVTAGVLVPLADANWDLQRWAVGAWFAVAAAGLGVLGGLKALVTGPRTR